MPKDDRSRFRAIAVALAAVAGLSACQPAPPPAPHADPPKTVAATAGEDSGAVSSDAKPRDPPRGDALTGTDWPLLALTSGTALIACTDASGHALRPVEGEIAVVADARAPAEKINDGTLEGDAADAADVDGADQGASSSDDALPSGSPSAEGADEDDGATPLADLAFASLSAAMRPCVETGGFDLHYAGKMSGDFTSLVQRAAAMADRLKIERRILDIDSTGGRLEDAMPAGDAIAESRWTIRVGADEVCHSACVLVLAAGDDREIDGKIGIHRMIRVGSRADTRAELSQELREVYGELKAYLERNGASVAVADLMMTVPNRSLRLLSDAELQAYGLSGANAVQDDLDRIRLARRCGDDFVKRRDAFNRAYAAQCLDSAAADEALPTCTATLQDRYGFPDASCPADSPLATLPPPRPRDASVEPPAATGVASASAAAAAASAAAGAAAGG